MINCFWTMSSAIAMVGPGESASFKFVNIDINLQL